MSFGGGLRDFGGWQWSLLQNNLNPSAPHVDFHSYCMLLRNGSGKVWICF